MTAERFADGLQHLCYLVPLLIWCYRLQERIRRLEARQATKDLLGKRDDDA